MALLIPHILYVFQTVPIDFPQSFFRTSKTLFLRYTVYLDRLSCKTLMWGTVLARPKHLGGVTVPQGHPHHVLISLVWQLILKTTCENWRIIITFFFLWCQCPPWQPKVLCLQTNPPCHNVFILYNLLFATTYPNRPAYFTESGKVLGTTFMKEEVRKSCIIMHTSHHEYSPRAQLWFWDSIVDLIFYIGYFLVYLIAAGAVSLTQASWVTSGQYALFDGFSGIMVFKFTMHPA